MASNLRGLLTTLSRRPHGDQKVLLINSTDSLLLCERLVAAGRRRWLQHRLEACRRPSEGDWGVFRRKRYFLVWFVVAWGLSGAVGAPPSPGSGPGCACSEVFRCSVDVPSMFRRSIDVPTMFRPCTWHRGPRPLPWAAGALWGGLGYVDTQL